MVEIRRANSTDIESIKTIYEKAFDKREGILRYYLGFSEYVEFCIKQNYSYIAFMENVVCGVLLAYVKPDVFDGKIVYIELLAVLPEYQKRGIGMELLNRVKADAQINEFSELSLRTGCYMDSYQIYKNYGFKDTRDDQRYMVMSIRKKTEE